MSVRDTPPDLSQETGSFLGDPAILPARVGQGHPGLTGPARPAFPRKCPRIPTTSRRKPARDTRSRASQDFSVLSIFSSTSPRKSVRDTSAARAGAGAGAGAAAGAGASAAAGAGQAAGGCSGGQLLSAAVCLAAARLARFRSRSSSRHSSSAIARRCRSCRARRDLRHLTEHTRCRGPVLASG